MGFKFQGGYFLQIDSMLSADELLVRNNTREFIEDNLVADFEACNREGRFPRERCGRWERWGSSGATLGVRAARG